MTKEFKKRMLFLLELDFLNGQIEKLKLEKEELRKQFSLNSVSQQREQLNGFRKWTSERANNEDVVKQEVIDDYLKTI